MRTILTGIRVNDLDLAVGFYTAVGYLEVGRVRLDQGCTLVVLRLPEEQAASLELVHRPSEGPVAVDSLDHLAVQVDDLAAIRADVEEGCPGCGVVSTRVHAWARQRVKDLGAGGDGTVVGSRVEVVVAREPEGHPGPPARRAGAARPPWHHRRRPATRRTVNSSSLNR